MKFQHKTLIFLSGLVWFAIGIFLLILGLQFVMATLQDPALCHIPGKFSLLALFTDPHQGLIVVLTAALLVGFIKGRFVLKKTVQRQVTRVTSLPRPAPLKYLYGKGFYLLIALMMGLGISLRFLPISLDTRGAIDIAIGAALMNGATLFFRAAIAMTSEKKEGS